MPFPFFTRSSSGPTPLRREQIPGKPAQQNKPSTFGYLFGKPSANQGQINKAAVENKPGFLRGAFRSRDDLISEIRKTNYYKSIPTYDRKLSETERISLIKELSKEAGGLSEERMKQVIKKMEEQKRNADYKQAFGESKELDQKIKQAKEWQTIWSAPKK